MAECALARCVHERRSFRKELHKWGKNVLFLAGLERVAEELVGREKWRGIMEPMLDIDNKVVSDWKPNELCYFCSARKKSGVEDMCPADNLATYNGAGGTESDGNLSEDAACSPSPPLDQPLDLSMGSKHGYSGMPLSPNSSLEGGENAATVLKVPQVPSKPGMKKRLGDSFSCKRSYTEEELQAALRDIQSGKLGTRRAAVIYGIPRSTLRNKVYKLAHERDLHKNNSEQPKEQASSADEPVTNGDADNASAPSASESLRQLLQNRITEKEIASVNESFTSTLSQFDYSHLGPLLSQVLANVHDLALAKLRSSCSAAEADSPSAELPEECRLSILPELIRRLAEERFDAERSASSQSADKKKHLPSSPNGLSTNGLSDSASSTTSKSVTTNPHNVILKIPSYKPMKTLSSFSDNQLQGSSSTSQNNSGNGISGKGIGVSLREIIARSITQRVAANSSRAKDKDHVADICNGSSDDSNLEEPPPSKKSKSSNAGNENENSQCTSTVKPEKRTRPKRGRYRNYNRDNLAEAVRAVQRGEMSVHRAGSYYGVPHSTLEYKVKERHLLRPRKRDMKNKVNNSHSSTKLNSSHSNSSSASSVNGSKPASTSAQDAGNDAKSFSGMAVTFPSHMPLWQNNPFFSLDFSKFSSNHFFASQMMRKLQEDALLHAENASDDAGNKDSMSLLSSIIRSGLEAQAEAAVSKTATVANDSPTEVEASTESLKKE